MTQSVTNKALLPVDNSLKTLEYRLKNKESMIFPEWSINRALKQVAADFKKLKEANQNLPKEDLVNLLSKVDNIKRRLNQTTSPRISIISMLWQKIFPNKPYAPVTTKVKESKITQSLENLEKATKPFYWRTICLELKIPGDDIDSILKDAAPLLEKTPPSDTSSIQAILNGVKELQSKQRASICKGVASIIDKSTPTEKIPLLLNNAIALITKMAITDQIPKIFKLISGIAPSNKKLTIEIFELIAPLIKPGMNYMNLVGIVAELRGIPSNNLIESLKSISKEDSTFTNSVQVVLAIQTKVNELKQSEESQNTNSQNSISDKKTQIK